ncbi:uncharacterized protein F4822DRAFT_433102 [Hypoxylon trugodes]|uniref:uncharacterized protein n=1 Tax=Hypoxylon trugodes TaxID=326681 RepID=UPI002197F8AE|nr:uncharacterized protein F4822DRAFT_433102 [Hypoxylon trugodes]KAI1384559.1 hypothetical protein F4822DRAFT_433102 [Hypoxylon trugodes]
MASFPNNYIPAFPSDRAIDERVQEFVSRFYETSDDPTKNEEWLGYFLPDAVIIIGDKSAKGTEGLRKFRQGMWEHVEQRRHTPEKVFPASFGGTGDGAYVEYMLHGSLDLITKNGEKQAISWAGRAVLKDVEGNLKYQYYEVYLHK